MPRPVLAEVDLLAVICRDSRAEGLLIRALARMYDVLKADPDAPHKQRHTVQRTYDRPVDEYGMEGTSYRGVVSVPVRGQQFVFYACAWTREMTQCNEGWAAASSVRLGPRPHR